MYGPFEKDKDVSQYSSTTYSLVRIMSDTNNATQARYGEIKSLRVQVQSLSAS